MPISYAANWGNLCSIDLLTKYSVDVNMCDIYQSTALHYAAYAGFSDIVYYLLDKGVEINSQDYRE
ncbi:MAG: ankyrin repeat domain-containing protein [Rickettsiales endosymbiont of Dermacentor nuttalli]